MIRSNSLTDWEKDEEKTHGYFDYLDGKAAFFVYAKDEQGQAVLHTVQVIEHEQDRILSIKDYYYCPEFIAFVAETTNHSPKHQIIFGYEKRRAGFPPALLFLYLQAMPTIKKVQPTLYN